MHLVWLLWACGEATPPPPPVAGTSEAADVAEQTVFGYARDLQTAERILERALVQTEASPQTASLWRGLANAYLYRQRLRGGFDDIDAAQRALERVIELEPDQDATHILACTMLQKRHQFRDALNELDGVARTPNVRTMEAAIRFQLGEYEQSLAALEAVVAEKIGAPDPQVAATIAIQLGKLGRFDEAAQRMRVAQQNHHGHEGWVKAWQELMLGLMDLEREAYDDALVHYKAADKASRGWWLVQEHIAEIDRLQGRPNRAIRTYEKVVEQTGSPELIGALADAYDAVGRTEDADQARAKALVLFRKQIKTHASLASGHAIEFLVAHGDPKEALALAEANAAMRPNGEAQMLLAAALDVNGRSKDASHLREGVRASGWYVHGG